MDVVVVDGGRGRRKGRGRQINASSPVHSPVHPSIHPPPTVNMILEKGIAPEFLPLAYVREPFLLMSVCMAGCMGWFWLLGDEATRHRSQHQPTN